jgi:hypothetical protein
MTISNDGIFLPLESKLESNDMRKMKWLLYGPPGTGKSTFLNQAGKVLFLSTDGGTKFLDTMSRPIDNWSTFKKYVKAISLERPKQYNAICLDLADHLVSMVQKYVCEKRGIEHQADEPYGKAYDLIEREFTAEILKLVGIGKYGLFFVSHAHDKERKTRFSTINKTEPTIKNPGWKVLQPMMDIIAYMGFDASSGTDDRMGRRMYFQPTESMEAKDRTTLLPESLFIPHPTEGNGFEIVEKYLLSGEKSDKSKSPAPKVSLKKKLVLKKK